MADRKQIDGKEVLNGSWGELWFDGDYMAAVISFKAEVGIKSTAVPRVQTLQSGQKVTGIEPKGEVKFHKTNSVIMKKLDAFIKKGKTPKFKIVSNLNDPDSTGSERVVVYDAVFDKITLADWEAEKLGEESYSFTFSDWDILDTIK